MVSVLSNGYTERRGWGFPFEVKEYQEEDCVSAFSLRNEQQSRGKGTGGKG